MKPLKELETRVNRTYRGGKFLDEFLGKDNSEDSFYPEDWISSFVEAKNKNYIENEGITRIETPDGEKLITDCVTKEDFGEGRETPGVLIKYLDSAERLGIQVHPTKEYAKKHFDSEFGKTECWHILGVREDMNPSVYLGFKEYVTKELFKELFDKQDIQGLLDCMHKFQVKCGDTVLVTGGMPHAIGAGCFLLEIQEPSDYTMRAEKVTVAGEVLTPMQIHYGVGEENMLDCFDYTPRTEEEVKDKFFLKPKTEKTPLYEKQELVGYGDTKCFALYKIACREYTLCEDMFVTVCILSDSGYMEYGGEKIKLKKSEKYFIAKNEKVKFYDCEFLVCCPPEIN